MEFSEQEKVQFPKDALKARINNDFTYHRTPAEIDQDIILIREKAKELAILIAGLFPASREQSTDLARFEETVMQVIARQYPLE